MDPDKTPGPTPGTDPAPEHSAATGEPARDPQCILCGRCLEVCPLLAATGREELSPRAKLFTLRRLADAPGELAERKVEQLAGLCLSCGRCAEVCPQGLDVPGTVGRVRGRHPGLRGWLWKQWIGRSKHLWPAASRLGAALPRGGEPGSTGRKIAAMAPGPPFAPWLRPVEFGACGLDGRAVLFSGCLGRGARKVWGEKALALLSGLGCETGPEPDWACCGATLGHAGLAEAERKAVARNLEIWRGAGRPRLVTFCASCTHGLMAAPDVDGAGFTPGDAGAWRAAVTPLSRLLGTLRLEISGPAPARVLYHGPCHARPDDADKAWLAGVVDGLDTGDGKDCCGLGGILQLGAPDLSREVASRLWARRAEAAGGLTGAVMLSGCSGCLTQLAATAPAGVAVGHWLDALDLSRT